MIAKNELRKKAKEIRASLDMKKLSEKIVEKIRKNDFYKNSKHVMLFYPLSQEVDLLKLLDDDKNFYLPRVDGENLEVCPYNVGDALYTSAFNTKEPSSKPVSPEILDLIFVPALMVDQNGYRLGYGGGFYDKFLSTLSTDKVKIAPIASSLIVDELPVEDYDIKMNVTICENFCE